MITLLVATLPPVAHAQRVAPSGPSNSPASNWYVPVLTAQPLPATPRAVEDAIAGRGLEVYEKGSVRCVKRPDRPLLLPHQAKAYLSMHLPCLGVLQEVGETLGARGFRDVVGGEVSVRASDLSEGSRRVVISQFEGQLPFSDPKDLPADARIRVTSQFNLRFTDGNGEQHVVRVTPNTPPQPFDPSSFAAGLDQEPGEVLPKALRTRLGSRAVVVGGDPIRLDDAVTMIAGKDDRLRVDRRASEWRVAYVGSRRSLPVAEFAEGVAAAHRLYWRSVGDAWFLSASPYDPRLFSADLEKMKACRAFYETLRPLAVAGALSRGMFDLLFNGAGKSFDGLRNDQQRLVFSLASTGRTIPNDGTVARLLKDRRTLAGSTVTLSLDTSMSVRWAGNSMTLGVPSP